MWFHLCVLYSWPATRPARLDYGTDLHLCFCSRFISFMCFGNSSVAFVFQVRDVACSHLLFFNCSYLLFFKLISNACFWSSFVAVARLNCDTHTHTHVYVAIYKTAWMLCTGISASVHVHAQAYKQPNTVAQVMSKRTCTYITPTWAYSNAPAHGFT